MPKEAGHLCVAAGPGLVLNGIKFLARGIEIAAPAEGERLRAMAKPLQDGPDAGQSRKGGAFVAQLGHKDDSTVATEALLSSGVVLISKPSNLDVPPWQMVSAMLGGVPLRTATFWNAPKIPTTTEASTVECWETWLGKPGPVGISLTGEWEGTTIELASGGNHAKLGLSLDGERPLVIFGDENQQGSLSGQCDRSQNGRGGLFFVLTDKVLAEG